MSDANDRFERLAEQFYRETGLMAPGKSVPAAMGAQDDRERWRRWHEWLAARIAKVAAPTTTTEESRDA